MAQQRLDVFTKDADLRVLALITRLGISRRGFVNSLTLRLPPRPTTITASYRVVVALSIIRGGPIGFLPRRLGLVTTCSRLAKLF